MFNLIAKEYDCNRRRFIPCFDDYYDNSTKFIFSCIKKPKRVLNLGARTGLLSYYWYVQCSSAEYMLVDIADEILDVSRKRFLGLNNATKGFEGERIDYDNALCNRMISEIRHVVELGHLSEEYAEKCIAEIHAVEQVQHK